MNLSVTSQNSSKSNIVSATKHNKTTHETIQKILLFCGILSSLLYVAMNIFVPVFYYGYSSVSQTVSELSAVGAPTRTLWISLGIIYTLLVTAFGWEVWQSSDENKSLRLVGVLIFIYGLVSFIWPFAPMHQREVLAAGGKTMSDTLHLLLAAITVIIMTTAMVFGAFAFGKRFRFYSIATIIVLLVFGALTALDAPKVQANLPTPYAGIWERINIGVFLLWIVVLAIGVLKKQNQRSLSNRNMPLDK